MQLSAMWICPVTPETSSALVNLVLYPEFWYINILYPCIVAWFCASVLWRVHWCPHPGISPHKPGGLSGPWWHDVPSNTLCSVYYQSNTLCTICCVSYSNTLCTVLVLCGVLQHTTFSRYNFEIQCGFLQSTIHIWFLFEILFNFTAIWQNCFYMYF